MKKLLTLAFAICALSVSAQYKHAVGGVLGSMEGFSYKALITEHFAIQTDLGIGLHLNPGKMYYDGDFDANVRARYNDLILNPNFMWQAPIITPPTGTLSYFVGGGGHIGLAWHNANPLGSGGINAIGGIEWVFDKIPLQLGVDFRPGYACLFGTERYSGYFWTYESYTTIHMFDYMLSFSIRYCIK